MLVSLALLGMAAALMMIGFGSGMRLAGNAEARIIRGESVAAAQSILRDAVERLRPVTKFGLDAPTADVDGDANQLTFVSLPPDAERPSAVRRYRLERSDTGDLVLEQFVNPTGRNADPQILLRNIERLDLGYYGSDATGGAAHWQGEWSQRTTAPLLVRIRLELAPGDRRFWPDLIVRPVVTLDTRCSLDPATGQCRGRS